MYLRGKKKEMGKSQRLSESIKYKVERKEKLKSKPSTSFYIKKEFK